MIMKKMINSLNKEQKEAVLETISPLRIIAGAGSGKTRVITTKISYLIKELKIDSRAILALTFTKRAANEMKERVNEILENKFDIDITTFHSFCYKFLILNIKDTNLKNNFQILDSYSQSKIIKKILKSKDDFNNDEKIDNSVADTKKIISKIKNEFYKNNNILENASTISGYSQEYLEIYNTYQKTLIENNQVDYDDLLVKTFLLLKNNPTIHALWSNKYKYILIDEFQDTNFLQFDIMNLIVNKRNCLTIVGDPDQTIYTWRGAKQEIILNLDSTYKNLKTIVLNQNYRSTKNILDFANSFITNNTDRYKKDLISLKQSGSNVEYHGFETDIEQAEFIAKKIYDIVKSKQFDYKNIFILYRTNKSKTKLEIALKEKQVPYIIKGGDSFFNLQSINHALAFLKVYVYKDDTSTLDCISQLNGVGDKKIEYIEKIAKSMNISVFEWLEKNKDPKLPEIVYTFIESFKKHQQVENSNLNPGSLLSLLLEDCGIFKKFESNKSYLGHKDQVNSLIEILNDEGNKNNDLYLFDKITFFLQTLILNVDFSEDSNDENSVILSTIHGAKGLENSVVFIYNINNINFPSKYNTNKKYIEEERRTFYVAVTRSKDLLFIVYNSSMISKFIYELGIEEENDYNDYNSKNKFWMKKNEKNNIECKSNNMIIDNNVTIGMRIKHIDFGEGQVVSIVGKNIFVKFDCKEFKTRMVPINMPFWKKI